MKKRKHNAPLLSAITLSMACTSLFSLLSAHNIYRNFDTDGWKQPLVSVLMQGLAHKDYPWNPGNSILASGNSVAASPNQSDMEGLPVTIVDPSVSSEGTGSGTIRQPGTSVPNAANGQGGTSSGAANGQNGISSSGAANGQNGTSSSGATNGQNGTSSGTANGQNGSSSSGATNGQDGSSSPDADAKQEGTLSQTEPVQYEFTNVTQEYFDDALFIGDSRVCGVKLYSGWDNFTYYAENGMTIYNMFQSKSAEEEGQTITIEEALQKRTFGKIYLEIGINEMGTGNVDSFMKAYEEAVSRLRELQPDAIIYVCGIMYVKQSKSESDPIFNNPAIQERNDRIAALADGQNIFYLDINELVTDDTGNLNPDYTWDEVHLLGKYDSLWLDYFCSHGIVRPGQPEG